MSIVMPKNKQASWIRYIKQRIEKNKNFLCFIGGQTGSGKSWSALSICQQLDKEFNIDRCVFSGKDLMQLINSGGLKKGSCVLFDESGIDLSNRNWQSTLNKMLNYLLQTFRHRCIVLFLTSPYMDFLDASTRKLMHAEFEMIGINFKENTAKIKPKLIQYNGRTGKYYFKYLRRITKEGVIPIVSWSIIKPTNDLIKDYEVKKLEFTTQLNQKIELALEKLEEKPKPKPLTKKQEEIYTLLQDIGSPLNVANKLKVHPSYIYRQIELIKNKGFYIENARPHNNLTSKGLK